MGVNEVLAALVLPGHPAGGEPDRGLGELFGL
jgi:hypothetical protein